MPSNARMSPTRCSGEAPKLQVQSPPMGQIPAGVWGAWGKSRRWSLRYVLAHVLSSRGPPRPQRLQGDQAGSRERQSKRPPSHAGLPVWEGVISSLDMGAGLPRLKCLQLMYQDKFTL